MSIEAIEERYRGLTPTSRKLFEEGREVNAGASKGAYYFPPYPLTFRRVSSAMNRYLAMHSV